MKRPDRYKDQYAMTPQEAARVLGCQPEEVHVHVPRFWMMNGRRKFRAVDVIAQRDRMLRKQVEDRRRNNRMVREAGR